MSCETTKRKRSHCWLTIKKIVAEVWGMSIQFSHMHSNVGRVQSRHDTLGGKESENWAADIQKEGRVRSNKDDFIYFCFSDFKRHHTLGSVTLGMSTFCRVRGHHVWWVQCLLLWRRRSCVEYIIPATSLDNSQEMHLKGDGSRQVSRAVSQTQEHDDGVSTADGQRKQRPVGIPACLPALDKLYNLWLQPITLSLRKQTFTLYCLSI